MWFFRFSLLNCSFFSCSWDLLYIFLIFIFFKIVIEVTNVSSSSSLFSWSITKKLREKITLYRFHFFCQGCVLMGLICLVYLGFYCVSWLWRLIWLWLEVLEQLEYCCWKLVHQIVFLIPFFIYGLNNKNKFYLFWSFRFCL